ncbi:MAG: GNAT family N-acetyltransferase [Crocinitomicaceae bacterium]|nr:GNAT family N-acetyltransferase [Crocinitomicaceae bacterium]
MTTVEFIDTDTFLDKLLEIRKMGDIIVCYHLDEKNDIQIVGSGTVIYEPKIIRGCKNVGHIEDIVVDKDHRKSGIAKNILEQLVELSKKNNCYKVILDCKTGLVGFYEKNGFANHGNQMSLYIL